MRVPLAVVIVSGALSVLAGYVMWRAASRGGAWGLVAGPVIGFIAFCLAVLIGYLLMRWKGPVWG